MPLATCANPTARCLPQSTETVTWDSGKGGSEGPLDTASPCPPNLWHHSSLVPWKLASLCRGLGEAHGSNRSWCPLAPQDTYSPAPETSRGHVLLGSGGHGESRTCPGMLSGVAKATPLARLYSVARGRKGCSCPGPPPNRHSCHGFSPALPCVQQSQARGSCRQGEGEGQPAHCRLSGKRQPEPRPLWL